MNGGIWLLDNLFGVVETILVGVECVGGDQKGGEQQKEERFCFGFEAGCKESEEEG